MRFLSRLYQALAALQHENTCLGKSLVKKREFHIRLSMLTAISPLHLNLSFSLALNTSLTLSLTLLSLSVSLSILNPKPYPKLSARAAAARRLVSGNLEL